MLHISSHITLQGQRCQGEVRLLPCFQPQHWLLLCSVFALCECWSPPRWSIFAYQRFPLSAISERSLDSLGHARTQDPCINMAEISFLTLCSQHYGGELLNSSKNPMKKTKTEGYGEVLSWKQSHLIFSEMLRKEKAISGFP